MSDAEEFLGSYKEVLSREVAGNIWPPELSAFYKPESCLSHSDSKEVYLVTDKRTGGRAVLRVSDLDASERADAEHAILFQLDFPGIPKTYGTLVKDGRSYLAREYFYGTPLDQVLAWGRMELPQIYRIVYQICSILGYLHAQDPPIIHRDIKPQNIILCPDGSLGLTDFGIARTFKESSTSDTQSMGTMLYAAPEQYGYSQSSPQTDIYALGIVLIYLATGSPDRRDLRGRIADPQLRFLIEKCIAFNPKDRFKNTGHIIKYIDSLKTRKMRIGVGVAAICLAVILSGIGIWQLAPIFLGNAASDPPSGLPSGSSSEQTPEASSEPNLVDATSLLGDLVNRDYPQTDDPRIGSTSWLYDYTNNGNLHGNINNGGFAVSDDNGETIYVSSDNAIYMLNAAGDVLEKVYSGSVDGSLNIYEHTLFFREANGIIHALALNSGDMIEFDENFYTDPISSSCIYFDNGQMYLTHMLHDLSLFSIKTDGSGMTLQSTLSKAYYTNIVEGIRFYVSGNDNRRIYAQNLSTGDIALLYDTTANWISVCNGRIYFQDETSSCIASIKLDGSDYRKHYNQLGYYVNATSHGVFFTENATKRLIVFDAVTNESKVVLDEGEKLFCIAGGWVFYRDTYGDTIQGMVREDGTDNRVFDTGNW